MKLPSLTLARAAPQGLFPLAPQRSENQLETAQIGTVNLAIQRQTYCRDQGPTTSAKETPTAVALGLGSSNASAFLLRDTFETTLAAQPISAPNQQVNIIVLTTSLGLGDLRETYDW